MEWVLAAWYVCTMALITVDQVSISFGSLPLLDRVGLQIEANERVCLIGRNGTGKSTLLQIINGDLAPDSGSVWKQPGVQVARLAQDATFFADRPVFDVVAEGLGNLSDLVTLYHHTAVEVSETGRSILLEKLGNLQHELEDRDGWRLEKRVELVLSRLSLPTEAAVNTLSGGWRRRVLLARALVSQPALLLLDEPTNHLDLDTITWLEFFLADYPGAVLFVTHDRAFLRRLATRIIELDRGTLTSWPGNYEMFQRKKEEWLVNESLQQQKFDKRLAVEETWMRQGVKARRTRNEGRVKALTAMRAERAARRELTGSVRFQAEPADQSGRLEESPGDPMQNHDVGFCQYRRAQAAIGEANRAEIPLLAAPIEAGNVRVGEVGHLRDQLGGRAPQRSNDGGVVLRFVRRPKPRIRPRFTQRLMETIGRAIGASCAVRLAHMQDSRRGALGHAGLV